MMNTTLIDFANEHTLIFLSIGMVCSILLAFFMIWLYPYLSESFKNKEVEDDTSNKSN